MERAAKGHKDITGSISRKREPELKDDISRMEIQAVTDLLEREAQSPSKDVYTPPGKPGVFYCLGLTVFKRYHCVINVLISEAAQRKIVSYTQVLDWSKFNSSGTFIQSYFNPKYSSSHFNSD